MFTNNAMKQQRGNVIPHEFKMIRRRGHEKTAMKLLFPLAYYRHNRLFGGGIFGWILLWIGIILSFGTLDIAEAMAMTTTTSTTTATIPKLSKGATPSKVDFDYKIHQERKEFSIQQHKHKQKQKQSCVLPREMTSATVAVLIMTGTFAGFTESSFASDDSTTLSSSFIATNTRTTTAIITTTSTTVATSSSSSTTSNTPWLNNIPISTTIRSIQQQQQQNSKMLFPPPSSFSTEESSSPRYYSNKETPFSQAVREIYELQDMQDKRLELCADRGPFWEQCLFGEEFWQDQQQQQQKESIWKRIVFQPTKQQRDSNPRTLGTSFDYQLVSPEGALEPKYLQPSFNGGGNSGSSPTTTTSYKIPTW